MSRPVCSTAIRVAIRAASVSDLPLTASFSLAPATFSTRLFSQARSASSSPYRGGRPDIPEDGSSRRDQEKGLQGVGSVPAAATTNVARNPAPFRTAVRHYIPQQQNHSQQDPNGPSAQRERSRTVSSFYNQTAIDEAAAMPSIRITSEMMMYTNVGNGIDMDRKLISNAQFLRRELPIRVAHRIAGIRQLPFIVGCNPTILGVHELYIRAFNILNDFTEVSTVEDADNFTLVLKNLLNDHKDVVSQLAQGFKECRKHIKDEDLIRSYLDKNLTSRLGIRMLATHQIALRDQKPNHVGIYRLKMKLKDVIDQKIRFVEEIAKERYGHAPEFDVDGHVSAAFDYCEMPLDYILPELLKNAVRATLESHQGLKGHALSHIRITIVNNERDFIIRISDRGGGIPHDKIDKVMQYSFSTAEESTEQLMDQDIFGNMMEAINRSSSGPMHGYGFGLPVSRAYAEYLGGSLTLKSMPGYGTDVYLKLQHIDTSKSGSGFRI